MNPKAMDAIVFHDTVGQPQPSEGMLFIPAIFDFTPESAACLEFTPSPLPDAIDLTEFVAGAWSDPADREWLKEHDAVWVRARVPAVFHFAPPCRKRRDAEWRLLNIPFLAAETRADPDEMELHPFVCTDRHPYRTGLLFSTAVTTVKQRQRIASGFWSLMMSAPWTLATYKDHIWIEDGGCGDAPRRVGFWDNRLHCDPPF